MGGSQGVWRLVDAAGPFSVVIALTGLGVMLAVSLLLCLALVGRPPPLLVTVGLTPVPWFLGIVGTEDAVMRLLAALPMADSSHVLAPLAEGTGEAMVARLLGAWTSAALLVGVALGLLLVRRRAEPDSGEESEGLLLGAALSLALGGIALLVALEAHHLFELLTALARTPPEAHAGLVATSAADLTWLHQLRSAALGALAVLALALISWQLFLRPEAVDQWAGSLTLTVLAALVLALDSRPLNLAVKNACAAGLPCPILPSLERPPPPAKFGSFSEVRGRFSPPTSRLTP